MEMVKIFDKVKKLVLSNTSSDLADCFKKVLYQVKSFFILYKRGRNYFHNNSNNKNKLGKNQIPNFGFNNRNNLKKAIKFIL